ncbi:MAG: ribonuclease P protein component [Chloroflexota bacterium]
MKQRFRLTRSADFVRVRRQGKSHVHPVAIMISLPNVLTQVRIGISAGKAVGNAVQRNRAKRVLRAAIAPLIPSIKFGHDIVLVARKPILEKKSPEVQEILTKMLGQAKLLEENENRS